MQVETAIELPADRPSRSLDQLTYTDEMRQMPAEERGGREDRFGVDTICTTQKPLESTAVITVETAHEAHRQHLVAWGWVAGRCSMLMMGR